MVSARFQCFSVRDPLTRRHSRYQYSIEAQQRGFLHAHIIVRLWGNPRSAEFVDNATSARMPPADDALRPLVQKFMMHNCKSGAICHGDGDKCKKGYPMPVRATTTFDAHGFPLYKRDAHSTRVVPYNAFLLRYLNCHINVEYCGSQGVVGYIFSYTYKGVSAALKAQVLGARRADEPVNELAEFRKLRTLGAFERRRGV